MIPFFASLLRYSFLLLQTDRWHEGMYMTILNSSHAGWWCRSVRFCFQKLMLDLQSWRNIVFGRRMYLDSCAYGQAPVCLSRPIVPNALHDSCQRLRQEHLIERFLEMQIIDRQTAMNSLGAYIDNNEERQHVLFQVIQVSWHVNTSSFRSCRSVDGSTRPLSGHAGQLTRQHVLFQVMQVSWRVNTFSFRSYRSVDTSTRPLSGHAGQLTRQQHDSRCHETFAVGLDLFTIVQK